MVEFNTTTKNNQNNKHKINEEHFTNLNVNNRNSIANMVERFVQSISQINDSGSFDQSFEVKNIQSPQQRIRHRCITELDRENLQKFLHEFETKQNNNHNNNKLTPKNSPYLCRKAKAIYQNALVMSGSRSNSPKFNKSRSNSPRPINSTIAEEHIYEDIETLNDKELMPAPVETTTTLQRQQPERSSYRSAAKVLQFFSTKKRGKSNYSDDSSRASSAATSPLPIRKQNDCNRQLDESFDKDEHFYDSCHIDDEQDDGISSAGSNFTHSSNSCSSRNYSPDSSFEMHPPLLPIFKITPPTNLRKSSKNPAYEFARFLRGSFHAKRASITTLRRSVSDPDALQNIDFTKTGTQTLKTVNEQSDTSTLKKCSGLLSRTVCSKKSLASTKVLTDATNIKRSDNIRDRALPSNASPFRRAWGQSSFRTPRTDKFVHNKNSPLVRRTASMTASDNDVYIKSMDSYIDEFKKTCSQQQQHHHQQQQQQVAAKITKISPTQQHINAKQQNKIEEPTGVTAWGTSFELLLDDRAGLHTFAEFLKKEFSGENIYFWTACERYRHIDNESERATQAKAIFAKHLANGALEPVNVDSQARNLTEEKLQNAATDIFALAQKQIFTLMKFDSYPRFIRSDLYKKCLDAEKNRQPLPYGADDLDDLLKIHQTSSSKLKKSASNAEDRRRKSLLPWHRKIRTKSRDRAENDILVGKQINAKLNQLSSSSLKIPSTQNSISDIHSSRSSLSSFDAFPCALQNANLNGETVESTCSLCRVILSDGATTIVQIRPNETVGQLVERLLEKRGLTYKFYDVVADGSTKSIDLNSTALNIAGKEVMVEQRVAFKIDLPDPKVISVKSKPKKQLHEVIRPILNKYQYDIDAVQVVLRDTQALVDLSQLVTAVDGLRLQVLLIKPPSNSMPDYQNGCTTKFARPALPKNTVNILKQQQVAIQAASIARKNSIGSGGGGGNVAAGTATLPAPPLSNLDEITNKVFNEVMEGKAQEAQTTKQQIDLLSIKSDDCASETSSLFERLRSRRDPNIPNILKAKTKKKSISSQHSEDASQCNNNNQATMLTTATITAATTEIKKPIIAKLKAGVRLQVTERVAENQDELLEGLKRAQLARLEDQRGTEINFELPDFLKNKENHNSAASKLRKVRANLSPINKIPASSSTAETINAQQQFSERPQPAPRLSTTKNKISTITPMKIDEDTSTASTQNSPTTPNTSNGSFESSSDYAINSKGPPPLPPKPKVLPIKPSNWGVYNKTAGNVGGGVVVGSLTPTSAITINPLSNASLSLSLTANKMSKTNEQATRCAFLEEPSSSFV